MTVQEIEKFREQVSEAIGQSAKMFREAVLEQPSELFLKIEKQRILSICGDKAVIEVDDNYIKDGRIMTEKTNGYKSKQNG